MKRLSLLLAIAFVLFGCSVPDELPVFEGTEAADRFAREFIGDILKGDRESCLSKIESDLVNDEVRNAIDSDIQHLSGSEVVDIKVVDCNSTYAIAGPKEGESYHKIAYEYSFAWGYVIFPVMLQQNGDNIRITSFQAHPSSSPISERTAFVFTGKPLKHYIFLSIALSTLFFLLAAIVSVVRGEAAIKTKAVWILTIILLSVAQVSMNWETGEFHFKLFHLALGGGFGLGQPSLLTPWFVTCSFPLGAILYWLAGRSDPEPSDEVADETIPQPQ